MNNLMKTTKAVKLKKRDEGGQAEENEDSWTDEDSSEEALFRHAEFAKLNKL